MARALPCKNCHKVALLRDGQPYLIGRAPSFPFAVHCARCKQKTRVTAGEFAALPVLTPAQLEDHGALDAYTADLRGAGFAPREAQDLLGKRLDPARAEALVDDLPPRDAA
jgi:hypothetical protein